MLKVKQSITLTGQSEIDGQIVVYFNATINNENTGNSIVTQNIQNEELYKGNKVQVRKDIAMFQEKIYEIEDEFSEKNKGMSV
ncbi:hypothetical protein [Carnobacterium maltaromaticum]|uniref:hypothetical protein n=1 Tax=Carnobacterium maltaromaticum TaxID=2751 RepID=UPI001E2876E3|nr:hypothetical protein [Carnobacterium maltaromaticum]